jgi:ATPase subunit of ABC transporter with duplicated ATPase domains
MEDLLDGWPGTLIVVSHDRYLLERVTDDQYALLGDGSLRHLTGGVDQYLQLRRASLNAPKGTATNSQPVAAAVAKLTGSALRDAEKNLSRIERALEKLAGDEAALHQQMAAHDQTDYSGLAELANKQSEFNAKRDALELDWLETSEQLQGK